MNDFSAWNGHVNNPESIQPTDSRVNSRHSIQWLLNPSPSRATSSVANSTSIKKLPPNYNPSFDTFPSEIRLQVYSLIFTRTEIPIPIQTTTPLWTLTRPSLPHSITPSTPSPTSNTTTNPLALLYCNRLLNTETTPLLYSAHIFAIEIFTEYHPPIHFPPSLPRNFHHITRMQTYRLSSSENLQVLSRFPKLKEIEFWLGFGVEEWRGFLQTVSLRWEREREEGSGRARIKKAVFVLHVTGSVSGEMIEEWERRRSEGESGLSLKEVYRGCYGGVLEEEGLFRGFMRRRVVQKGSFITSEGFEHPGTIRIIVE